MRGDVFSLTRVEACSVEPTPARDRYDALGRKAEKGWDRTPGGERGAWRGFRGRSRADRTAVSNQRRRRRFQRVSAALMRIDPGLPLAFLQAFRNVHDRASARDRGSAGNKTKKER